MKKILIVSVDLDKKNGQSSFANGLVSEFISDLSDDFLLIVPNSMIARRYAAAVPHKVHLGPQVVARNYYRIFLFQLFLFFELVKLSFKRKNVNLYFSLKPTLGSIFLLHRLFPNYVVFLEGEIEKNFEVLIKNLFLRRLAAFCVRSVISRASKVNCAYESAFRYAIDLNRNSNVVNVGLNPAFSKLDSEFFESNRIKKFDICYVGSFRKVHELERLIDFGVANDCSLVFVGLGEEFDNTRSYARKLGAMDNCTFLGPLDHDSVVDVMYSSRYAWCVTSFDHWGVPIKAFEALSLDIPVVVSPRESFEFIERMGFGVNLRVFSKASYVSAWSNLREIGRINSRKFIIDSCNWERWFL